MNAYVPIILADILLGVSFICQKQYQRAAGTTFRAGLIYNALIGFFSAIMFLIINRFVIKLTMYSVIAAAVFSTVLTLYTVIGFKIMKKGNMSLYTLFLMSGGMTVPYIWGVLFLNEELTFMRTMGLIAIIAAIVIANSDAKKPDKKQLLMCVAVFLLNGISSVASKMHQISPASEIVTSSDFAFIANAFKATICSVIMLLCRKKITADKTEKLQLKLIIPIIIFAAVTSGVSYMLQLIGAVTLPATVLYPFITGGTVILTSLAGVLVFKEKLSARQWSGVAVCFVGTLLFL